MTPEQLDEMFKYHQPNKEQLARYESISFAGRALAATIIGSCPPSTNTADAVGKVREAVMLAHASIALEGKPSSGIS